MAKQAEAINAVAERLVDVADDLRALRDQFESDRENMSDSGTDALRRLNSIVEELDKAVGDANNSDATTPPVDPTDPGTPANPDNA